MTPQEFKAWFEGFTEAFDGWTPSRAQWARICERVGEIDGKPITEKVFVDRWWPYYPYWYTSSEAIYPLIITCNDTTQSNVSNTHFAVGGGFNIMTAMNTLGQVEAMLLVPNG